VEAPRWWMRFPDRVLAENAALCSLVDEGELTEFRWMKDSGGDLRVEATLNIYGAHQPVEVRFPERYPGECPAVRPVPYGTQLSSHQFGGDGVLCLELGPDNWHNRFMAADLLHSAWTLLGLELVNAIAPIPIPSRHVDSLGGRA
jgi:sulfur-carrier protein adenylyltransferase/sulfurtransferase